MPVYNKEVGKTEHERGDKTYVYPRLVLSKEELEDADFAPGDKVQIITKNGKIIIKNKTS